MQIAGEGVTPPRISLRFFPTILVATNNGGSESYILYCVPIGCVDVLTANHITVNKYPMCRMVKYLLYYSIGTEFQSRVTRFIQYCQFHLFTSCLSDLCVQLCNYVVLLLKSLCHCTYCSLILG